MWSLGPTSTNAIWIRRLHTVAAIIVFTLLRVGQSNSSPLFEAHFISYPIPGGASLHEPTYLNADPYPDFVVVGTGFQRPAQLSIVYGTRDGDFAALEPQILEVTPHDFDLVDVSGDGHLDIVMVEYSTNVLRVLVQLEEGVFQPSHDIPTVAAPSKIVTGDLNLDGREDIVVRPYWSTELGIHMALEGGGFSPVRPLPFEEYYAQPFQILDVTHDGKPDLIFALRAGVVIWPGDGVGGFGTPIQVSTVSARDCSVDDFNGDGRLDIAALGARTLRIFIAQGDGSFVQRAQYQTAIYTSNTIALTSGDVNNDGHPDIFVSNRQTYRMLNFIGNGDGTFEQRESLIASSSQAVVLDVSADGRRDVVLPDGRGLTILPGRGDGNFVGRREYVVGRPGDRGFDLATSDLNHDGHLDVVTANALSGTVSVLLGVDDELHLDQTLDIGASAYAVELADVDADGSLDLIVGHGPYPQGLVSILIGQGNARFDDPITTAFATSPSRIRTADFDHDGHLDLAVSTRLDFEGTGGMIVLLGDGSGAFPRRQEYDLGAAQDLVVGDFDHDGNEDVVLVTSNGLWRSYHGRGDGSFEERSLPFLPRGAWEIETADVDGDNNLDLMVATGLYTSTGNVVVFRGSMEGTFALHQTLPFNDPMSLAVADLDGDGIDDLAVGGYSDRAITVYSGSDNGDFTNPIGYGAVASPKQLRAVDIDGDNALDLLTVNLFEHSVSSLISSREVITPVILANLTASPHESGIAIEWELRGDIGSEIHSVRVTRGAERNGAFVPITPELQPRMRMSFLDQAPQSIAPWYRVEALLTNGSLAVAGPVYAALGPASRTGLVSLSSLPGSIRIRYALDKPGRIALRVYDVRGRLVRTLVDDTRPAGTQSVEWDWQGRHGNAIARGVYAISFRAPGITESRKIVRLQR